MGTLTVPALPPEDPLPPPEPPPSAANAAATAASVAACAGAIGSAVIAEVRFIAELDTFLWQSQSTGSRSIAAPRMLIADWFCGIGCFSLGAQRAGSVPVCAIESNADFRP